MAKFLVTEGANFEPLSYAEIALPLEYKRKLFDEYSKESDGYNIDANAYLSLISDEPDSEAYKALNEYINNIKLFTDSLYNVDTSSADVRKNLSDLRKQGSFILTGIKDATERRTADRAEVDKLRGAGEAIIAADPTALGIDKYYTNNTYSYRPKTYSASELVNLASKCAGELADQNSNTFIYDAYNSNGTINSDYSNIITTKGFTNSEINKAFAAFERKSADGLTERQKQVYDALSNIFNSLGLNSLTGDDRVRALDAMRSGFDSALQTRTSHVQLKPKETTVSSGKKSSSEKDETVQYPYGADLGTSIDYITTAYSKTTKLRKPDTYYNDVNQYVLVPRNDGKYDSVEFSNASDLTDKIYRLADKDKTIDIRDYIYSSTGGLDIVLGNKQDGRFAIASNGTEKKFNVNSAEKEDIDAVLKAYFNTDSSLYNDSLFNKLGVAKESITTNDLKAILTCVVKDSNDDIDIAKTLDFCIGKSMLNSNINKFKEANSAIKEFDDLYYNGEAQEKIRKELGLSANVLPSDVLKAMYDQARVSRVPNLNVVSAADELDKNLRTTLITNINAKAASAQSYTDIDDSPLIAYKIDSKTGRVLTEKDNRIIFNKIFDAKNKSDARVNTITMTVYDLFTSDSPLIRINTNAGDFGIKASDVNENLNRILDDSKRTLKPLYTYINSRYDKAAYATDVVTASLIQAIVDAGASATYLDLVKGKDGEPVVTLKSSYSLETFEIDELMDFMNMSLNKKLNYFRTISGNTEPAAQTPSDRPKNYMY